MKGAFLLVVCVLISLVYGEVCPLTPGVTYSCTACGTGICTSTNACTSDYLLGCTLPPGATRWVCCPNTSSSCNVQSTFLQKCTYYVPGSSNRCGAGCVISIVVIVIFGCCCSACLAACVVAYLVSKRRQQVTIPEYLD